MGKVRLRMPPSIASMLREKGSDWFILEQEIREEATIGDLLAELAAHDDSLHKAVFDADSGKVSDRIMVFLNDNLLQSLEVTEAKLSDGDSLILLPVYSGG